MSAIKYGIGDRVLVKSVDWYNENKDLCGVVNVPKNFVSSMSKYCGKVVAITRVGYNCYYIAEDNGEYAWSDEMFEGHAFLNDLFAKTGDVTLLPSTLEHCATILGVSSEIRANDAYLGVMMVTLQELYICRDAYWKIANNWRPNYNDINTKKHCIVTRRNKLGVATTTETNRVFAFPTPEMAERFATNFASKLNLCRDML